MLHHSCTSFDVGRNKPFLLLAEPQNNTENVGFPRSPFLLRFCSKQLACLCWETSVFWGSAAWRPNCQTETGVTFWIFTAEEIWRNLGLFEIHDNEPPNPVDQCKKALFEALGADPSVLEAGSLWSSWIETAQKDFSESDTWTVYSSVSTLPSIQDSFAAGVLAWTTSSRKSVPFDGTQIEIGTAQQRGRKLRSFDCPVRRTLLYLAYLGSPGCIFRFSLRQRHIQFSCRILIDCVWQSSLYPGWSFGWSTWGMESWAKDDISGFAETSERKERGTSEAAGGRKNW